jgi:proline iminopeptidase
MARTPRWLVLGVVVAMAGCAAPPWGEGEVETKKGLENGSFTAEINGFAIHYEVHGEGPVVMVLPNSWGLALEGLRGFYRPLEEHVTMVYFDPRGMGESGAVRSESDMGLAAVRSDFDGLRVHLGLDRVHAIGWSNGAMNLILLAAERPHTLESAVFLHGAASFDDRDMQEWAERQPELFEEFGELQQRLESGTMSDAKATELMKSFWVGRFFPASCADPEAMAPRLASYYEEIQFSWPHARHSNREAPVFDARDRLSAITARCLVVAGAHDSFPPDKVRELHDGLANSEFVVFESSGHFAPLEEPEAFRQTVVEFWGVS